MAILDSMKQLLLGLFLLSSVFGLAQTLTVEVPEPRFQVDNSNYLIVVYMEDLEAYSDLSAYQSVFMQLGQDTFGFNFKPTSLRYTSDFAVFNANTEYRLYFTQLPLISIVTQDSIVDEPKVAGRLTYVDASQELTSDLGVELRGGSTLTSPKKTLDLELWEDSVSEKSIDAQFGELRSDDDWILDALYNEPLRLRSTIAHKLWLSMHTLYYQEEETKAKSGADVMYVELFLNGAYNGIYALSEQLDRKQMKLKKYKEEIRGELYKATIWGAPTYGNPPGFNNANREWAGYEMKYPKEDEATDWQSVFDFVDFVVHSSDEDFVENIWEAFDFDNHLDYFIFLNLLRATDNTGKNIYLAKYNKDEPYYNVPWDLDGCFGTIWNGTDENVTDDILTNGLHNRVIELNPNDYETAISTRWFEYRNTILSAEQLLTTFQDQFDYFKINKIYEREALVYPNYDFNEEDLSYLRTWLQERLVFLDSYFGQLSPVAEGEERSEILLYPNPVNGKIYLKNHTAFINKEYSVISEAGQELLRGTIKENFISMETLAAGVYVLLLDGGQYRFVVGE